MTRRNSRDRDDRTDRRPLETLAKCEEITEEEARRIHPALFEHLKRITDES